MLSWKQSGVDNDPYKYSHDLVLYTSSFPALLLLQINQFGPFRPLLEGSDVNGLGRHIAAVMSEMSLRPGDAPSVASSCESDKYIQHS